MADRLNDLKETMTHGFTSLHARFDSLDARMRETETDVAVLQDRMARRKSSASKWGAGAGAALWAVVEGLSRLFASK